MHGTTPWYNNLLDRGRGRTLWLISRPAVAPASEDHRLWGGVMVDFDDSLVGLSPGRQPGDEHFVSRLRQVVRP